MMKSVPVNRARDGQSVQGRIPVQPSSKDIQFKIGQVFQGKVVHAKAHGLIHVASGGKTLKAHTWVPLEEGKSYSFQVRAVFPRIELKVAGEDAPNQMTAGKLWLSGLKERLQFVTLLQDLASSSSSKTLRSLLPLLLYKGPGQEDAAWLFRSLLNSGIFWENKVFRYLLLDRLPESVATLPEDDLKGILLRLKMEMKHSASQSRDTQDAMDRIDRLLAFLEKNQTLNLNTLREDWGWYWFIPGADRREFLHGELFGRKEEGEELHRLHMNLSFSRLGEIHVDCVLQERRVSISLQVTGERIARFLEENIRLLEKGMEKQGLVIARLACEAVPDGSPFNPFSAGKSPSALMDMVI